INGTGTVSGLVKVNNITINQGEDVFLTFGGNTYPFKTSYLNNKLTLTFDQNPVPAFTPAAGSPISVGAGPVMVVAVTDINGDGKPALPTANSFGPPSVSVLLGNGSGGFTATASSPISTGGSTYPRGLAVGDVNGDGKPDIVTANYYNTANVLL